MIAEHYQAIRQRVLDDQNKIRRHVNVFVDGENVRYTQGGATQVSNDTEIWIHPALPGGCDCRFDDTPNDYRLDRALGTGKGSLRR